MKKFKAFSNYVSSFLNNDTTNSIKHLEKAHALSPHSFIQERLAEKYCQAARASFAEKHFDEAIDYAKQALALFPDSAPYKHTLITFHEMLGKRALKEGNPKGLEHYKAILTLDSTHAEARKIIENHEREHKNHLTLEASSFSISAKEHYRNRDFEAAANLFEMALINYRKLDDLYGVASVYYQMGKQDPRYFSEGIEILKKHIEKTPGHKEAHELLGNFYRRIAHRLGKEDFFKDAYEAYGNTGDVTKHFQEKIEHKKRKDEAFQNKSSHVTDILASPHTVPEILASRTFFYGYQKEASIREDILSWYETLYKNPHFQKTMKNMAERMVEDALIASEKSGTYSDQDVSRVIFINAEKANVFSANEAMDMGGYFNNRKTVTVVHQNNTIAANEFLDRLSQATELDYTAGTFIHEGEHVRHQDENKNFCDPFKAEETERKKAFLDAGRKVMEHFHQLLSRVDNNQEDISLLTDKELALHIQQRLGTIPETYFDSRERHMMHNFTEVYTRYQDTEISREIAVRPLQYLADGVSITQVDAYFSPLLALEQPAKTPERSSEMAAKIGCHIKDSEEKKESGRLQKEHKRHVKEMEVAGLML